MKLAGVYAVAMTAASSGTLTAVSPIDQPVIWTQDWGGGPVPVVPALIGIVTCMLVRVIVGIGNPAYPPPADKRPRHLLAYNIAVTLLTMLATAAYISDQKVGGPGRSFLIGLGCGAVGEGFIRLGKTQFLMALKAAGRAMLETLYGAPKP